MIKICNSCHTEKPRSDFSGSSGKCRICRNTILRLQRLANKDEVNRKNRESYQRNKTARRKHQKKYETKVQELTRIDKDWHAKYLVKAARVRARKLKVPCNLKYGDIIVPTHCPILGIELAKNIGSMGNNSATIDRIVPEIGYVKENIIIISCKANRAKANLTIQELRKIADFYEKLKGDSNDARINTEIETVIGQT